MRGPRPLLLEFGHQNAIDKTCAPPPKHSPQRPGVAAPKFTKGALARWNRNQDKE